jgi:hypothetical protein
MPAWDAAANVANIADALNQSLLVEADVDAALARTLVSRFRLGMFDPPELDPWADIAMDAVGSEAHRHVYMLCCIWLGHECTRQQNGTSGQTCYDIGGM